MIIKERDRFIYGWFRFGGVTQSELARQFCLSPTRVNQIIGTLKRTERAHDFWLREGGPQIYHRNPTAERSNGRAQRGNGGKGKCTPFNGD